MGEGNSQQDGGRVGVLNSPVSQTYLDNFQNILDTYKFDLRSKERTAGMLRSYSEVVLIPVSPLVHY